jgi:hypothetical protein
LAASYTQSGQLNPNLKAEHAVFEKAVINESQDINSVRPSNKVAQIPSHTKKSTTGVNVTPIGTCANAYGYSSMGGQRAIINVDNAGM